LLRQGPEVQEVQPRWLDEQVPFQQEEPLLRSGPELLRSDLRRSVCADLCGSRRRLLPLSTG
jgi:hypothetical protein